MYVETGTGLVIPKICRIVYKFITGVKQWSNIHDSLQTVISLEEAPENGIYDKYNPTLKENGKRNHSDVNGNGYFLLQ